MESPFYGYYYISTDCISDTWNTRELESFLLSYDCLVNNGMGSYKHSLTFLSLQLLLVKNYDSWGSNDYNPDKTNYIVIVTSKKLNPIVEQFFKDFEIFTGRHITEETDDN